MSTKEILVVITPVLRGLQSSSFVSARVDVFQTARGINLIIVKDITES